MKDSIKIILDKPRRLRYTAENFDKIRKKLQISKEAKGLVEKKIDGFDLKYIATFLWAGLLWEDPELKFWQVKKAVEQYKDNQKKLKELIMAIIKAEKLFRKRMKKAIIEVNRLSEKADRTLDFLD